MKHYNPFREIVTRLFRKEPLYQRIPDVTEEDVFRIVRRDFTEPEFDSAVAALNEYGAGRSRVHLAALKLAGGNLERLKQEINSAKRDYRDVLAAAEYPNYFYAAALFGTKGASRKEQRAIIDKDWKQYQAWLQR